MYWLVAELGAVITVIITTFFIGVSFAVYSYFDAQFGLIRKIAEQGLKPPPLPGASRTPTRFEN